MSSYKKIDLQMDFAAGFYLSEVQIPIYPHPITNCIRVCSILIHTGKGGGGKVEPERRLDANSSNSWVENTNTADGISSL
jgi:hypothetical protein